MSETFRTPEGFDLPKPLLLPDVRDFNELFEYVREWDHATMTAKSGVVPSPELVPLPALVDELEIGPFLSAKLAGGQCSMAIEATALTVNALAQPSELFATIRNEGRISFELAEHKRNGRVLVTAMHSQMTRYQYLAYIDPATIPLARAGHSTKCPRCGGRAEAVVADGTLTATCETCGWTGTKSRG